MRGERPPAYVDARRALLGASTERDFSTTVVDLARLMGWRVFHQWSSVHSEPGWPDLVLVRPPRLVFAELKAQRGKASPAQRATLDALIACEAEVYLWRPDDLDEIEAVLKRPTRGAHDAPGAPQ